MRAIVINLAERADRLEIFKANNDGKAPQFSLFEAINGRELTLEKLQEKGFDTDKSWRDPILGRVLTWGEIGCFLSHFSVWEMVASGDEPVLVMEDDAVLDKPLREIEPFLGEYELLYLSHVEMNKNGVRELSEDLVRPMLSVPLSSLHPDSCGCQEAHLHRCPSEHHPCRRVRPAYAGQDQRRCVQESGCSPDFKG